MGEIELKEADGIFRLVVDFHGIFVAGAVLVGRSDGFDRRAASC